MGYCIHSREVKFRISSSDKQNALLHLKAGASKDHGWRTLEEALDDLRWSADVDDAGNITTIEFTGEKYWDDEKSVFKPIAQFVQNGSFIEIIGEEGKIWRWYFQDGEVKTVSPTVTWPQQ